MLLAYRQNFAEVAPTAKEIWLRWQYVIGPNCTAIVFCNKMEVLDSEFIMQHNFL
jgi:hypothetical protein